MYFVTEFVQSPVLVIVNSVIVSSTLYVTPLANDDLLTPVAILTDPGFPTILNPPTLADEPTVNVNVTLNVPIIFYCLFILFYFFS